MKLRILKTAGEWTPGIHEVPEFNAKRLIHNGYAERVEDDATVERAAEQHGPGRGRPGKRREVRG